MAAFGVEQFAKLTKTLTSNICKRQGSKNTPLSPATEESSHCGASPMAKLMSWVDVAAAALDVFADETAAAGGALHLRRALLNLMQNAVRYSPDGSTVTITAGRVGEEAVVAIADCGCGIAADDLVVLEDVRHAIPAYDAVLMIAPRRASDPVLRGALAPLIGAIPVERMREANLMVDRDTDKASPKDAARFLANALHLHADEKYGNFRMVGTLEPETCGAGTHPRRMPTGAPECALNKLGSTNGSMANIRAIPVNA